MTEPKAAEKTEVHGRRSKLPLGCISRRHDTFQVFDTHRYVIDTYVRTCTTGGERDPNHNMVPDVFETGHGDGQGKQQ